jgi:hypothetical protein
VKQKTAEGVLRRIGTLLKGMTANKSLERTREK